MLVVDVVVLVVSRVVEVVDEVLVDVVVVEVEADVVVVVVGGTLHLPALPAFTMAAISDCDSARLKRSISSIRPCQASEVTTTFLPITMGSVTASIVPVCAMLASSTPFT